MKTILMTVVVAALCGCSSFQKEPARVKMTSLGTQTTYAYTRDESGKEFYLDAVKSDESSGTTLVRDKIIDELMGLIDDQFESYSRALRDTKATKNIFVKIASISLTGAAPFSSATAAKALAGIDTGLKGASAAIDLEAWNNQAPEILISTMRGERAKIAAEISLSKVKGLADYSLQGAIRDLIRYSNAGHITSALTALTQQAAESAKKAEANAHDTKLAPQETLKAIRATQELKATAAATTPPSP